MARRERDYHAEYVRRLELARERFPTVSRHEQIEHARGHRSAADLEAELRSGKVEQADVTPGPEKAGGRRAWFDIKVEFSDGRPPQTFRLQGQQAKHVNLVSLADRLGREGVHVSGIEYLARQQAAA